MTTLDALTTQSLPPNAFSSYPSQTLAATSHPASHFVSPVSTSPNTTTAASYWTGAPAQSSWPVNNNTHEYLQDAWNLYQAPNPNPITDSTVNSNLAISQPYEIPSLVPSFSAAQPQQPLSAENSLPSSSSSSSSFSSSVSSPASMNSLVYPPRQPWPSYSLPAMNGPVRTNIHNPGGHMAVLGNMPSAAGILPGFNSGHIARMYQGPTSSSPHLPGSGSGLGGPTQDRPFKCDQCPQSFNRNHDLKRHKRIHLSVKPFPCTHCDKSFSRKDALKRHLLVKGCGKDGPVVKREHE
ncbi:putative C2H2 finger domain protein [Aspergillus glaucus CBS 516.65]|uniref:C2H2-type domain-containing protein n=1 Tax=Aspergillus glaucus CBS 516.65 TaxID=1160497 RepID=A0A1L9V896_ASPGL|nr:hypothetical protein ASPGLDRAFT_39163 [Aspergillus glaucus CBS 516.65]OJJ80154.1 hypothetical protein ASPGLDRAFT_39163 [Aspergillus glaucus CBS 516.65]